MGIAATRAHARRRIRVLAKLSKGGARVPVGRAADENKRFTEAEQCRCSSQSAIPCMSIDVVEYRSTLRVRNYYLYNCGGTEGWTGVCEGGGGGRGLPGGGGGRAGDLTFYFFKRAYSMYKYTLLYRVQLYTSCQPMNCEKLTRTDKKPAVLCRLVIPPIQVCTSGYAGA